MIFYAEYLDPVNSWAKKESIVTIIPSLRERTPARFSGRCVGRFKATVSRSMDFDPFVRFDALNEPHIRCFRVEILLENRFRNHVEKLKIQVSDKFVCEIRTFQHRGEKRSYDCTKLVIEYF